MHKCVYHEMEAAKLDTYLCKYNARLHLSLDICSQILCTFCKCNATCCDGNATPSYFIAYLYATMHKCVYHEMEAAKLDTNLC